MYKKETILKGKRERMEKGLMVPKKNTQALDIQLLSTSCKTMATLSSRNGKEGELTARTLFPDNSREDVRAEIRFGRPDPGK